MIALEHKEKMEEAKSPPKETTLTPSKQLQISPNPNTPTVASEIPATGGSRPPEPSSTTNPLIHIPSYSRWFSWNNIHECEVRFLPEFFDGRSPSKNPRAYKYYRNLIIKRFRGSPARKITFTEARKTIIGDVGSVRRVFNFLEAWGLINYSASASKHHLKWEDRESKSNALSSSQTNKANIIAGFTVPKKRLCSGCKSVCSIACYACDKYQLTLCARCYAHGNYHVGVMSSDFRLVEISEDFMADWTDKETLHLLEAIMHFEDDWKKVAEHVGGRSERECATHFIKLPFAEQFIGPADSVEIDNKFCQTKDQSDVEFGSQSIGPSFPTKRMRLSPLADASNLVMAQAAFLSALAGAEVAEAAAGAAVRALYEDDYRITKERLGSPIGGTTQQECVVAFDCDNTSNTTEGVCADAQLRLEKEDQDLQRAVSEITEVQMKKIQDKVVHLEEFELQTERQWQQLQQMKNLLFVDQLTLFCDRTSVPKSGERTEENVKKNDVS
ncbi:SWI/SNF complex subunit SWI3B-like isoform X1 [Cornus florida]|uniref:SWI/SNF complex subunit SWI3B-like isoform X1 n=1 Tax=Cornus florida TaxID=4283 RepID=UPI00289D68AE|nr:SWI/SNF complex subunit SWI3B-like isoform X1 [Cornus florida]